MYSMHFEPFHILFFSIVFSALEDAFNDWFKTKDSMTFELAGGQNGNGNGVITDGYVYAFLKGHYFDKNGANIDNTL